MSSGERYTRLPVEAVSDLLRHWSPSRLRSLEPDGSAVTIVRAGRCSESAEPCTPPCGLWWVETETVVSPGVGFPDQVRPHGQHMKDEDWLPIPVTGLPKQFMERSLGDHGYWS